MDLIRIYSEIAFSKVALRYLSAKRDPEDLSNDNDFPLSKDYFLDEARIHHPELSDDNLTMIYRIGVDEWSHFGYDEKCKDDCNIFQTIACLASQMVEDAHPYPLVHFKDLFRWREITQLLGEDLLTCALLAFCDRKTSEKERCFDWPSVIHNDNPHLSYLFREKGLCELHSHLKASTNTFEISWVCLMNYIAGMDKEFQTLTLKHEPSAKKELGEKIYQLITEAAKLRWHIYMYLKDKISESGMEFLSNKMDPYEIDSNTAFERSIHCDNKWLPDYICLYPDSPMSIYVGERWFLYTTLKLIYSNNNPDITASFYRYILSKSLLRSYFIQINKNIGFSNFQRYQDLKSKFLKKEYSTLLESLPMWEARNHNYTKIFESRIAPVETKRELIKKFKNITKWTNPETLCDIEDEEISNREWTLIFHFIKRKDKRDHLEFRNTELRKSNKKCCHKLSKVARFNEVTGIDAASSEFAATPEVFSQSFRFLRHFGYDATFHAGEDFYDIADGLRAIDETINLLQLHASDRIGHALALGINAAKYYEARHNTIAMPKQHMLDNVVWLLMKSKEYGIQIDIKTEWFLNNVYKIISNEIGYCDGKKETIPDISDYWDSMALRGDNPELYEVDGSIKSCGIISPDTWDYYALLDSERAEYVRRNNSVATNLHYQYHSNPDIRKKGKKVKAFRLPDGYSDMITELQNAMMQQISKLHLCIECCPSSNVRIGRLERFDSHPIFRFMPINPGVTRYPLAVTVNTDDLGVFSTSLPNEYSLLALALLKLKNSDGTPCYSTQDVYDWISRVIDNGYKFTFHKYGDATNNLPF